MKRKEVCIARGEEMNRQMKKSKACPNGLVHTAHAKAEGKMNLVSVSAWTLQKGRMPCPGK